MYSQHAVSEKGLQRSAGHMGHSGLPKAGGQDSSMLCTAESAGIEVNLKCIGSACQGTKECYIPPGEALAAILAPRYATGKHAARYEHLGHVLGICSSICCHLKFCHLSRTQDPTRSCWCMDSEGVGDWAVSRKTTLTEAASWELLS